MEGTKNNEWSVSEAPRKESAAGIYGELVSEMEVNALIHNVVKFVEDRDSNLTYEWSYYVAKRVEKAIKRQGGKGMIADMIVAGALLAPSFKFMEAHKNYHPIEFGTIVRENKLDEGVGEQVLEGVERIVRGYLGADTVMKEFVPKPGSPEYLVATAYELLAD